MRQNLNKTKIIEKRKKRIRDLGSEGEKTKLVKKIKEREREVQRIKNIIKVRER